MGLTELALNRLDRSPDRARLTDLRLLRPPVHRPAKRWPRNCSTTQMLVSRCWVIWLVRKATAWPSRASGSIKLVGQMRIHGRAAGVVRQKRIDGVVGDALGRVALAAVAGEAGPRAAGILGQQNTHVPGPTDGGLSRRVSGVTGSRPRPAGCRPGWPGARSPGCPRWRRPRARDRAVSSPRGWVHGRRGWLGRRPARATAAGSMVARDLAAALGIEAPFDQLHLALNAQRGQRRQVDLFDIIKRRAPGHMGAAAYDDGGRPSGQRQGQQHRLQDQRGRAGRADVEDVGAGLGRGLRLEAQLAAVLLHALQPGIADGSRGLAPPGRAAAAGRAACGRRGC